MNKSQDVVLGIAGLCVFSGLSIALGTWGYQLYVLARTGEMPTVSFVDLLYWFHQSEWLYYPTDWLGVHKAMTWLNGGFAAFILSCGVAWTLVVALDS